MTLSQRLLYLLGKASQRGDLVIAVLILVAVVMMLIPLPTFLVDALITANIALSVLILLVAFYVSHPLEFSSMPSVILIATLFRLAITITTTRLILLQADAGEIITAFGNFVVGGSIAVGLVVFLIITVAQFIVIARGAERVAEVAARFTLDALPGKQMSIDAELRNGDIDQAEARHLRRQLERESQLFGAMDGAMKFVKGDSIAGMVVAVVNIVGGTVIGVTQRGIPASEALNIYGILTIGDGLVSQIPSLIIAISAGILITRSGDTDVDVGAQIGGQFFNQPKALFIAGGLIFLFALIPGFPKPQLFTLAFALGGFGYVLKRIQQTPAERDAKQDFEQSVRASTQPKAGPKRSAGEPQDDFSPTVPIILDISQDLSNALDFDRLNDELAALRRALYFDLGVPFPGINLRGPAD